MEWPAPRKVSLKIETLVDVQLSPREPRKNLETHFELYSRILLIIEERVLITAFPGKLRGTKQYLRVLHRRTKDGYRRPIRDRGTYLGLTISRSTGDFPGKCQKSTTASRASYRKLTPCLSSQGRYGLPILDTTLQHIYFVNGAHSAPYIANWLRGSLSLLRRLLRRLNRPSQMPLDLMAKQLSSSLLNPSIDQLVFRILLGLGRIGE
jgi:hypothetical protein